MYRIITGQMNMNGFSAVEEENPKRSEDHAEDEKREYFVSDKTLNQRLGEVLDGYAAYADGPGCCDAVVCDAVCDAVICDSNVCDVVCDKVCDAVCDKICDGICDTICDKICDAVCDAIKPA